MMDIITHHALIEQTLTPWKPRIGDDFAGYRGHVYRMFNFCLALRHCTPQEQDKLALAACFHDIGLWSDQTVDYLPPSVWQARQHLAQTGRDEWADEIALMIDLHHKLRRVERAQPPLVELFRQGDLVDFSLGMVRFGLSRRYVRSVKQALPNAGFHRFLLRGARDWFLRHPFSPPPFIKW